MTFFLFSLEDNAGVWCCKSSSDIDLAKWGALVEFQANWNTSFFICPFCQVQNQSVWKVCAPQRCQKRIMCLLIDPGDAQSASMSIVKGRGALQLQNQSRAHQTFQALVLCSSLETGSRAISIHDSLLIFSSFPWILQHCFPFFLPQLTQVSLPSSNRPFSWHFSSQSHHLMAGVVLITIRFQSPTASVQRLYWIQCWWWISGQVAGSNLCSVHQLNHLHEETSRLSLKKIRVSGIISHFFFYSSCGVLRPRVRLFWKSYWKHFALCTLLMLNILLTISSIGSLLDLLDPICLSIRYHGLSSLHTNCKPLFISFNFHQMHKWSHKSAILKSRTSICCPCINRTTDTFHNIDD